MTTSEVDGTTGAARTKQEARIRRKLKSLGLELWTCSGGFKLTDRSASIVLGCKPVMTLAEIEAWISANAVRAGGSRHDR